MPRLVSISADYVLGERYISYRITGFKKCHLLFCNYHVFAKVQMKNGSILLLLIKDCLIGLGEWVVVVGHGAWVVRSWVQDPPCIHAMYTYLCPLATAVLSVISF